MWMLLVLLYGVLKGAREIVKKKALTKSSVIEVLFFYTLLGFLFVTPQAPSAMGLEPKYYPTKPAKIPFNVNENDGLPYLIQDVNMVDRKSVV